MSDRRVANEEKNLSGPKETRENEQKPTQDSEMYCKWEEAADEGPQKAGLRCYVTLGWRERNPHTLVREALWTKEMCSPDQSERPQKKSRCEGLLTWLHWQRNYENSCGNYNSARPWRILSPASPSAGYSFSLQLDQWFCLWLHLGITQGAFLNFLMLRLHSHPRHLKWLPGGLAGICICSRPPRSFQNMGTIELD